MEGIVIKKTCSLVVALVMLAVMVVPAMAAPPEHFNVELTDGPYLIADCGDFTVWALGDIQLARTTFFDKGGNPTRVVSHWAIDSTYYSPETGKSVPSAERITTFEKIVDGQYQMKQTGVAFKLNMPGYGQLIMDVGHIVFDEHFNVLFSAGQHPWNLGTGDFTKLCAFFSE
jgi:hypothetical protein